MDLRAIREESTPEGRLAMVARHVVDEARRIENRFRGDRFYPDRAEFRARFAPFMKIELLQARLEEAKIHAGAAAEERVQQLTKEISDRWVELLVEEFKKPHNPKK